MNEYTAEIAHAAVARGAAWLDSKCPDWINEIHVEQLDLRNTTFCVLGQTARCLLGRPNSKRQALRYGYNWVLSHGTVVGDVGPRWATEHGFNIEVSRYESEDKARYEMLTIAWREYIRQRLEAVS